MPVRNLLATTNCRSVKKYKVETGVFGGDTRRAVERCLMMTSAASHEKSKFGGPHAFVDVFGGRFDEQGNYIPKAGANC